MQPTHNGPIQRPLATILSLVSPEQSESLLLQNIGLYRVPICQLYDLRCAVLKIKPQFTPLAVVVHQIFVDSGGDRFIRFLVLRLPQRDRVCGIGLRCFCRVRQKDWFSGTPISNGTTTDFSSLASGKPCTNRIAVLQRCWTLSYPNLPV